MTKTMPQRLNMSKDKVKNVLRRCRPVPFWVPMLVKFVIAAVLFILNLSSDGYEPTRRLMFGIDPSEALAAEEKGVIYRDLDGTPIRALAIAKKYGHEWARVRVMVEPDGRYGLFQDLDYVLAMAEDVKHNYGMKLLLDFHYSHWWTDGSNQWIPLSWRKRTQEGKEVLPSSRELQDLVYRHTYECLEALLAQGTFPDAVQVGNEIMGGMLWDEGRIPDHWQDFVQITHSGVRAIQDVVSSSSLSSSSSSSWFKKLLTATGATAKGVKMPKIIIHLDQGGYRKGCEEWFQSYLDRGGKVDIIGLSYYPMWHGSFRNLAKNVNNLASKFDLDVWIVETAYFWKGNPCDENDWKCEFLLPFDQSEDGQYEYLQEIRKVLETKTTRAMALFYWGSHWSQAEKWFVGDETWEEAPRRALFNDEGRALKGWTAWT